LGVIRRMNRERNASRTGHAGPGPVLCAGASQRWRGLAGAVLVASMTWQNLAAAAAETGVLMVTHTRPTGPGSLAHAIVQANTAIGTQIQFQIPTNDPGFDRAHGMWTIRLSAPLPNVTGRGIIIDGTSQPQAASSTEAPRVALVAGSQGVEQALAVLSDGNTVRGLAVGGFKHGVVVYGAGAVGNTVADCFIGLAPGDMPMPNETGVIMVEGARGNTISGCVISGNKSVGVYVADRESRGNVLRGNRIGTDAVGQRRRPNSIGVMLARAPQTVIRGNLISGNDDIGVLLVGKLTERSVIVGNLIGVDATGTKLVHNDKGIVIKSLANGNIVGGAVYNSTPRRIAPSFTVPRTVLNRVIPSSGPVVASSACVSSKRWYLNPRNGRKNVRFRLPPPFLTVCAVVVCADVSGQLSAETSAAFTTGAGSATTSADCLTTG
jgi:parallel beta-helix repeat protein